MTLAPNISSGEDIMTTIHYAMNVPNSQHRPDTRDGRLMCDKASVKGGGKTHHCGAVKLYHRDNA